MIWFFLTCTLAPIILLIIWDAASHDKVYNAGAYPPVELTGSSDEIALRTARQSMRAERARLTVRLAITSGLEAEETVALRKEITESSDVIKALDLAIAEEKGSSRTAIMISATSTLIAAMALLGALYNAYSAERFQRESKQIDAAVAWCREMSQPSFITYQQSVRRLRAPSTNSPSNPFRLRDEDKNSASATLRTPEAIFDYLKNTHRIKDEDREQLTANLVALLNYIETGAAMVARGDMEQKRFIGCFKNFKEAYFERWDSSYIGRALSLQAQMPGKPLRDAAAYFDKTACVFEAKNRSNPRVCDQAEQ